MDTHQIAWAAGLFEGEGCFTTNRKTASCALLMTDGDVVNRFHAVVSVGHVYGPYYAKYKYKKKRGKKIVRKQVWRWSVSGFNGMAAVFELFKPYLGVRRTARATEVLAMRPPPRPESPPCGFTKANSQYGYVQHWQRGEPSCAPCRDAKAGWAAAYRLKGRTRPKRSLTKRDVCTAKKLAKLELSHQAIADQLRVKRRTITRLLAGETYRNG
jgi:hypothetical protein